MVNLVTRYWPTAPVSTAVIDSPRLPIQPGVPDRRFERYTSPSLALLNRDGLPRSSEVFELLSMAGEFFGVPASFGSNTAESVFRTASAILEKAQSRGDDWQKPFGPGLSVPRLGSCLGELSSLNAVIVPDDRIKSHLPFDEVHVSGGDVRQIVVKLSHLASEFERGVRFSRLVFRASCRRIEHHEVSGKISHPLMYEGIPLHFPCLESELMVAVYQSLPRFSAQMRRQYKEYNGTMLVTSCPESPRGTQCNSAIEAMASDRIMDGRNRRYLVVSAMPELQGDLAATAAAARRAHVPVAELRGSAAKAPRIDDSVGSFLLAFARAILEENYAVGRPWASEPELRLRIAPTAVRIMYDYRAQDRDVLYRAIVEKLDPDWRFRRQGLIGDLMEAGIRDQFMFLTHLPGEAVRAACKEGLKTINPTCSFSVHERDHWY